MQSDVRRADATRGSTLYNVPGRSDGEKPGRFGNLLFGPLSVYNVDEWAGMYFS